MPTSFDDLLNSFEFVSSGGGGQNEAFLCRSTGKIHWRSDVIDSDMEEDFPEDVEDDDNYVAIPDKRELDLGKPMVLDFAREFLPHDFDDVRYMFSKRGAYRKWRTLLIRRSVLERWYAF